MNTLHRLLKVLLTGGVVLAAVGAFAFKYLDYITYPWTRNGQVRANVIQIAHQRTFTDLSLRATEVEATLETLGSDHTREVIAALRADGYDPVLPANEVHPDERWAADPEGHH